MFAQTTLILGSMAAAFIVTLILLKATPELAMIIAAVIGAAVGGFGFPVRHLVEGTFTYFDIILTIIAATLFMKVLQESGMLTSMIRSMVRRFYRHRAVLLVLLMFVMLIPGTLTGAGTVSVLVSGGIVATVLGLMGVPPVNRAAIVFLGAVLSVFAPPVNVYAMIIAGGVNMPYVGFFAPLAIVAAVLAVFCVLYLGWRGSPMELDEVLKELPSVPETLEGFRSYIPLLFLVALMIAVRVFPSGIPILGLPLQFLICTAVALIVVAVSRVKLDFWKVSNETITDLFPLIATLVGVGILVQTLTLTGVRGLFVITIVSLPTIFVYLGLVLGLPLIEAVLLFGVAAVIGVPSILLLSSLGHEAIIATAGLTLIAPLGDALPPTSILGRITINTVGYDGSYASFLKALVVPWIVISAVGLCLIVFSNAFSFLLI
jgi:TRAP-type C4-dicarboxylate transport system permease large subunit